MVADEARAALLGVHLFDGLLDFGREEVEAMTGGPLDVALPEGFKEALEDMAGLEVELLQRGGIEDQFARNALMERGFSAHGFIDDELVLISLGEGA